MAIIKNDKLALEKRLKIFRKKNSCLVEIVTYLEKISNKSDSNTLSLNQDVEILTLGRLVHKTPSMIVKSLRKAKILSTYLAQIS